MNTKQRDILSTQENADDNPKQNSTLTEREPIEGTPFTLIKYEDKYFAVMGDHKITETCNSPKETNEWIENNKWLILINMIAIAVEKLGVANEDYKLWKLHNLTSEKTQYETESL